MGWFGKHEKEKEEKREVLCSNCGGTGKVTCSNCGGSGDKGAPYHFTCEACDGEGKVYCPCCNGSCYVEE